MSLNAPIMKVDITALARLVIDSWTTTKDAKVRQGLLFKVAHEDLHLGYKGH